MTETSDNGWQPIAEAPHACHVVAAYFDPEIGEWVYSIEMSPWFGSAFTHWQPLPAPPGSST